MASSEESTLRAEAASFEPSGAEVVPAGGWEGIGCTCGAVAFSSVCSKYASLPQWPSWAAAGDGCPGATGA